MVPPWYENAFSITGSLDRESHDQSNEFNPFELLAMHDDVIKWKKNPRYCPFVRGIHRSPVNACLILKCVAFSKDERLLRWYPWQRLPGGMPLQWRHNGRDSVSNHQPHDCLLRRLFRHRSNKTSKLRITGLWAGNSPLSGEFPAQMSSNTENVSIWWRHHAIFQAKWLGSMLPSQHIW